MLIKELTKDDMASLADLYFLFWNERSDVQKMQQQFPLMSENYILLGCFENDRLVGSVMGVVCMGLYGNCESFLVVEDMVVDSTYRRRGIGKALFLELEKRAKIRNCTQVILVTDADRLDACGFYESIGFHPAKNKGYKKKL
ncbi:MAG: GNAT family N-acetyltransferase [Methanomicrobiales archaeon]|jgi:GNAT superfamily N-acetyltransferase|nr:GNAT family N-acetyltransferase [Methanomicrobiales archaeon]